MPDVDGLTRAEHVQLCVEKNLLEAAIIRDCEGHIQVATVIRITANGHDFLDLIRDDRRWKKILDKIKETIGNATLESVIHVGKFFLYQALKSAG